MTAAARATRLHFRNLRNQPGRVRRQRRRSGGPSLQDLSQSAPAHRVPHLRVGGCS
jgi:hypothetical protein